jgi:lycopene cyclase domain-containing protein
MPFWQAAAICSKNNKIKIRKGLFCFYDWAYKLIIMLKYSYLFGLLFSIVGVLIIDWKWRLVWWQDALRAGIVVTIGWVLFIIWDLLGIGIGIFYPGQSAFMVHLTVWPGLPLEELLFLWFLAYQTLIIWEGYKKWKAR